MTFITIPNQITLARLLLAVIFFVLLTTLDISEPARRSQALSICFWIFLAAALGDVLDGFLARMMRQETSFGRIVDPVVDKVMILGAFIFFASPLFVEGKSNITSVAPWMVVVILVRELLVSAIRSYSESSGRDFGAVWVGKVKMFVQSTTVCVILGQLAWFPQAWMDALRQGCVWATVIVTTLSILTYVQRARAFLLSSAALGGTRAARPPAKTLKSVASKAEGLPV